MKKKVLFVCIHNSARSQMAEAFLNKYGEGNFEAQSAGIEPGILNPTVVEAMKELGIDISGQKTKSVQEMIDQGKRFDYVVTVCDETNAERCPTVPGTGKRFHFSFADPSGFAGTKEEKLALTRSVRDGIKKKIQEWIKEVG